MIFLFITIIVGCVLFFYFSQSPFMQEQYVIFEYKDKVQKEYGFTTKQIEIVYPWSHSSRCTTFAIDFVDPDGKAELLGFKSGDLFRGIGSHGPFLEESGLYYILAHRLEWGGRTLTVINLEDYKKSGFEKWREINIKISLENSNK